MCICMCVFDYMHMLTCVRSGPQLEQEAEGWRERLSELEEEKRMSETSHNGMMENCVNKDARIKVRYFISLSRSSGYLGMNERIRMYFWWLL